MASFAVHAVAMLVLGSTTGRDRTVLSQKALEIAFTIEEPPPLAHVASALTEARLPEAPVVARASRWTTSERLRKDRRRHASVSEMPSGPSRSETSPAEVTLSPEVTKPSRTPNLDPEAAARAVFRSGESVPGETLEAATAATARGDGETPDYFEGVGKKRYLSKREPPILRRQKDGTHHYRGQAFRATVAKDGSVTFDDRYKQGTTVSFDITDALMRRHGEDPYRYEKEWFLQTTATLRKELFERWKDQQTRIALRKLRMRLLRISKDVTLTPKQKEARVLAIFRSTAEDEAGAAARRTIGEFVASRMPGIELSDPAP